LSACSDVSAESSGRHVSAAQPLRSIVCSDLSAASPGSEVSAWQPLRLSVCNDVRPPTSGKHVSPESLNGSPRTLSVRTDARCANAAGHATSACRPSTFSVLSACSSYTAIASLVISPSSCRNDEPVRKEGLAVLVDGEGERGIVGSGKAASASSATDEPASGRSTSSAGGCLAGGRSGAAPGSCGCAVDAAQPMKCLFSWCYACVRRSRAHRGSLSRNRTLSKFHRVIGRPAKP
jgi:hypothetical protein